MEEDLHKIRSDNLRKPYINKLLHALTDITEKAIDSRDEQTAKNPELRRALVIVEYFLRKKKRLCYGGMAINAHLPSNKKIYDFSKTIPDYDFFSPTPEKDMDELVSLLNKAKFDNVTNRLGMHEGTYKIFVNYHGIADITYMTSWLYSRLIKTSIVDDSIHYVDADYLRMGMYIELSRPRGEVERWDKVYKRLLLLNLYKPVKSECKEIVSTISIKKEIYDVLLKFIIEHKFIFTGAELGNIYKYPNVKIISLLKTTYPIIVYCQNPRIHLSKLRQLIFSVEQKSEIKVVHWERLLDIVPEMYGIKVDNKLTIILIEELYCYSYNTITVSKYGKLLISSLDTAIALFFTLSYLRGLDNLVPETVLCFAHRLVDISTETRDKNKYGQFPPFNINCSGHQPTKESLLKAKAERIFEYKRKTKKNKKDSRKMKTKRSN
jgi:hypothetical protein